MKDDFTVHFYEEVEDALLKYAVIIAKYQGKYIFCKHRARDTWELPGGHREAGETIEAAARRELWEETGATDFRLSPLCVYCVEQPGREKSFGMLWRAEVCAMEELRFEIETIELFDSMPRRLTYPWIQPFLLEEARRREAGET